jgi:hypothetical protein
MWQNRYGIMLISLHSDLNISGTQKSNHSYLYRDYVVYYPTCIIIYRALSYLYRDYIVYYPICTVTISCTILLVPWLFRVLSYFNRDYVVYYLTSSDYVGYHLTSTVTTPGNTLFVPWLYRVLPYISKLWL